MGFSDEDLKEYKERAIRLDRQHTLALLHRLECAERAAQFMYISAHPIDESSEEAYQQWLASKSEPKDKGEGR